MKLNEFTKKMQKHALSIFDAVNNIQSLRESLIQFPEKFEIIIEKALVFIQNVNARIQQDNEMQSLQIECAIDTPTDEIHKTDIINNVRITITSFVKQLVNEIDKRFITNSDQNASLFKELSYFDPAHFDKELNRNDFAIKNLLERVKIDISNENIVFNELKMLAADLVFTSSKAINTSLTNFINDYESDDEGCLPVLIVSESDLEEIENDTPIHIEPTPQGCKCIECILMFINESIENQRRYSNLNEIFRYIGALPSTEVKCERDFSKMKIIKNRLRSSLGNTNMENLLILSAEAEMFNDITVEDILNKTASTSEVWSKYLYQSE